MKYFTPEMLERFGSDDDRIALAAQDELERRSETYGEHLKGIATKLPPRFLEMQHRFYLHDARVVGPTIPLFRPDLPAPFHAELRWDFPFRAPRSQTGPDSQPSFLLALRLDPPPQEVLVLHYRFARVDEVRFHAPTGDETLPFLEWRHDEVELVPSDEGLEFGHSILFANGLELIVRFRDFDYATLKPMTPPAVFNGAPGENGRP
jgi:hypothetical protein